MVAKWYDMAKEDVFSLQLFIVLLNCLHMDLIPPIAATSIK